MGAVSVIDVLAQAAAKLLLALARERPRAAATTGPTAGLAGLAGFPAAPRDVTPAPDVARQLGTQTLYVLSGNLFTLAVGLPLQIVVARVIGSASLGIYGLIDGAISTANGLLSFGIAPTAVRFIPAHLEKGEYGAVRRLLALGAAILLTAGGLAYIALLVVLPRLGQFWPQLAPHNFIVAVMALLLPLGLLMFFLQQALRGFREIRYIVFGSSVLQLTVKVLATIGAFAFGFRLEGYVLATVLANLVGLLWMARGLKRKVDELPAEESKPSAASLQQWWRYAAICYGAGLLDVASARLDRFMLGVFVDASAVGVLMVVLQLQQLPVIFLTMQLSVGAPMFAAAHSRDAGQERDHLYALMTDWAVKSSLPLIIFLTIFANPVLALFGPGFADRGTGPMVLLLVGQAFSLATGPAGSVAMMSGLERTMLQLSIGNTILMAVLTIGLAVPLGLFGVALARLSTTVFINISVLIAIRRKLNLRWWNGRFLFWLPPAALCGGVGLIVLHAGVELGAVTLAVVLMAMYLSFALTLYAQGFHEDERELLRIVAGRLLKPSG